MIRQYRATAFRPDTLRRIEQAVAIITEYDQKLTARQVYYQFVARDLLANTTQNYKLITATLTDARYAGLIPWDRIEDRGREPTIWNDAPSIDDHVDRAMRSFRLPRWRGQNAYVELWVEKQALAGVLEPIAARWHVPLMVNKGYSSASAMHESARRMIEACNTDVSMICSLCQCIDEPRDYEDARCPDCGERWKPQTYAEAGHDARQAIVLYLGDHDPSGEDMVRDIRDRLTEFGVLEPVIHKVALTMAQIRKHKPPPNPAKLTDSRARAYVEKYGNRSWELDALPPKELNSLVEVAIRAVVDVGKYNDVIKEENRQRARLRAAIEQTKDEL